MVRLFHVYYPVRTVVLFAGEALIVCASFVLATLILFGQDSVLVLNYEGGFVKILGITAVALLCSHYFDLYEPQRLSARGEIYARLLVVLGVLSFLLAGVEYFIPEVRLQNGISLLGLMILTLALVGWRLGYTWLVRRPFLRERVYVLGGGERANQLVEALRNQAELGMDVVGWAGAIGASPSKDALSEMLLTARQNTPIDRVILAMRDRRNTMPVRELLDLRLQGVKIEDATSVLEKVSGKIEIDELNPSWLIFSDGFRLNTTFLFVRRVLSIFVAIGVGLVFLPLLPLIWLAIKLDSPGPVLYGQKRVGLHGKVFTCWKFRSMRQDAEASTGATWAGDDDPRVTRVGKLLRKLRLDEIPQLWNVLRGDMGFVGPRPERPEFVDWLTREIPYYQLRHIVPPGLTGWAQVSYSYGASLEDSKEKLRYDLYYIKHIAPMLDLLIVFNTIKIVLLGRGSR